MPLHLVVEVKITPHPEEVTPEEFDRLMDGELTEFEKWFINKQRLGGNKNPSGLISAERAIVKSFMIYLSTKSPEGD